MLIQLLYVEIKNPPCVHRSPATITKDIKILSANRIIRKKKRIYEQKNATEILYFLWITYYAVNRINFLFLFQGSRTRT